MEALNEATRMQKRFLELLNRQEILVLPGLRDIVDHALHIAAKVDIPLCVNG
jgi:hypothetical protein